MLAKDRHLKLYLNTLRLFKKISKYFLHHFFILFHIFHFSDIAFNFLLSIKRIYEIFSHFTFCVPVVYNVITKTKVEKFCFYHSKAPLIHSTE